MRQECSCAKHAGIAAITPHGCVRLWDVKHARCMGSVKLNTHQWAAWHPNGSEILYVDMVDTLSVISATSLKVIRTGRYKSRLNSFCFNSDGSMLYVVSASKFLQVRPDALAE